MVQFVKLFFQLIKFYMKMSKKILVVDDEIKMQQTIREILETENYIVKTANDGLECLEIIKREFFDVILLDINLPFKNGLEVLNEIKILYPDIPVIMFTAFGSNERIITAMKSGAYDYLDKPFELDELLFVINRAVEYSNLITEVKNLRSQTLLNNKEILYDEIIGSSQKMKEIFKLIGRAAPTDVSVLIEGESGSGKEIIADTIQKYSKRSTQPYIKINCAAIPETLLESELFGYEKGAFTDATSKKQGRLELADKGTIFLDEINNMSIGLQTKLLRFLQHKTFERVGGKETLSVDVRIISATNKKIEDEVRLENFREDLFYRLNIIHIKIPALREHADDIDSLVDHFIRKHKGSRTITISDEAMIKLKEYNWPGNIRELENVIQRAIVLSQSSLISLEHLPRLQLLKDSEEGQILNLAEDLNLKEKLNSLEKSLIIEALRRSNGNRSKASEILGINRRLLFTKINQYDIKDTD